MIDKNYLGHNLIIDGSEEYKTYKHYYKCIICDMPLIYSIFSNKYYTVSAFGYPKEVMISCDEMQIKKLLE